ncbi:hypothetical protein [Umezawaea sp. Da 62-37]|uniref:hypothetical protein n=1 Tax=Umezawaea sp. Da 62-37 TaxID=3075927 RepID=UPI0028F6C1C3|nr:hypothetical protein [Umezawaea sp. Da 62-37]WNV85055.1 hypothetical protein RM788_44065 [Umezawaea sp. Da 62-37]
MITSTATSAPHGRADTSLPTEVPPPPTAPTAATTNFHDPAAVARDWMTQWCPFDYREPRNNHVERSTVFATPAAKTADLAHGTTVEAYRTVVMQKLSRRCDQVTGAITPNAEHSTELVAVLTARRTDLATDAPVGADTVAVVRSMLLQPDGRWLVDVPAPLPR